MLVAVRMDISPFLVIRHDQNDIRIVCRNDTAQTVNKSEQQQEKARHGLFWQLLFGLFDPVNIGHDVSVTDTFEGAGDLCGSANVVVDPHAVEVTE